MHETIAFNKRKNKQERGCPIYNLDWIFYNFVLIFFFLSPEYWALPIHLTRPSYVHIVQPPTRPKNDQTLHIFWFFCHCPSKQQNPHKIFMKIGCFVSILCFQYNFAFKRANRELKSFCHFCLCEDRRAHTLLTHTHTHINRWFVCPFVPVMLSPVQINNSAFSLVRFLSRDCSVHPRLPFASYCCDSAMRDAVRAECHCQAGPLGFPTHFAHSIRFQSNHWRCACVCLLDFVCSRL